MSEMTGDEIRELRMAADETNLYFLLVLDEPMNRNGLGGTPEPGADLPPEGGVSYDISLRDEHGGRDLSIAYDPRADGFVMMGYPDDGSYSIGVASQALEVRISWEALGNPGQLYQVNSATRDCTRGECVTFDEGPCFAEAGDTRQP